MVTKTTLLSWKVKDRELNVGQGKTNLENSLEMRVHKNRISEI